MDINSQFAHLTALVANNLKEQHDWVSVQVHTQSPINRLPLARQLVSGLPPTRIYMHPDEQIMVIEAERATGQQTNSQTPEFEWVFPVHLAEKLTLDTFSAIFDSIGSQPREDTIKLDQGEHIDHSWRGSKRLKRVLLAVVHDDSTVVYYLVHDGIVKPRQN